VKENFRWIPIPPLRGGNWREKEEFPFLVAKMSPYFDR
jgi:hypothetical protein